MSKMLMKFVILVVVVVASSVKDYSNYQIWRFATGDVESIHKLESDGDISILHHRGKSYEVMVSPERSRDVNNTLHDLDIQYRVAVDDLQAVIDKQAKAREEAANLRTS